jgi:hypothetical protein
MSSLILTLVSMGLKNFFVKKFAANPEAMAVNFKVKDGKAVIIVNAVI